MDEELVDVAEMLQHHVELPDDRISVFRREKFFPLADYVVEGIVVAFEQHLNGGKMSSGFIKVGDIQIWTNLYGK
jgi:hypothetical protein